MVLINLTTALSREERHSKRLGMCVGKCGPVGDLESSMEGDAKDKDVVGIWRVRGREKERLTCGRVCAGTLCETGIKEWRTKDQDKSWERTKRNIAIGVEIVVCTMLVQAKMRGGKRSLHGHGHREGHA